MCRLASGFQRLQQGLTILGAAEIEQGEGQALVGHRFTNHPIAA
jgi:hypothetical protein